MRDDEPAARALGVRTFRHKILVISVSAAAAAAGGGILGLVQGSIFPDSIMGMGLSVDVLIGPVVGGLGTTFGPLIGCAYRDPSEPFDERHRRQPSDPGAEQYHVRSCPDFGRLVSAGWRLACDRASLQSNPGAIPSVVPPSEEGRGMTAILEVKNLSRSFGGLVAVKDVNFTLETGRITALIGPNGAGKTTCFNLVAGSLSPTSGQVFFEGRQIDNTPPETVCRMGIARTFQIVRPMRDMSVLENAMVGAFSWTKSVKEAKSKAYRTP